jgi:hypothetical protein
MGGLRLTGSLEVGDEADHIATAIGASAGVPISSSYVDRGRLSPAVIVLARIRKPQLLCALPRLNDVELPEQSRQRR